MRITNKKISVHKRMVKDTDDGLRSPDLFEAVFLDKGFSQSNMLQLLSWSRKTYEKRRDKLQRHITVAHLKKMARLLDMNVGDCYEVVVKNAPLNRITKKEVEVMIAKSLYKERELVW